MQGRNALLLLRASGRIRRSFRVDCGFALRSDGTNHPLPAAPRNRSTFETVQQTRGGTSMNVRNSATSLSDVLYEFSLARAMPDAELLDQFVHRYPEHAAALTDLA